MTPTRLARVERAEVSLRAALADAGIDVSDLRVRDLGTRARVEVDTALVDAVRARPDVLTVLDEFDEVEIDPRGFRSGAMNEMLPDPDRWR